MHRDLKPENLFVSREGQVTILDFGLAKLTQPGEGAFLDATNAPTVAAPTHAGTILGTAGYMSPEQVRGEPADRRSDLFSFGVILYEMLAGARAFNGASPVETMSAILRDQPPELSRPGLDVPPPLQRVIGRCLQKRADDRFQTARDLRFALEEATGGLTDSVTTARLLSAPRSRTRWWAAVGLALVLGVIGLDRWVRGQSSTPPITSLAVLPLRNLSNDPEQEYFSDGMTEALIADLARVNGLNVISRTSAMTYKSARKPLPEIARELNVAAVVEGSVVRSGDRVRITAQLIDAKTDRHLWANSYERDLRDVLTLEGDVARAITQEIRITLTPRDEARFATARQVNPAAHEAYLRGRYHLEKGNEQAIKEALDDFKRAIEADPAYAPAYAGLSDSYAMLRVTYAPPNAVMPQAKAAAAKAVQLDAASAEGHVSMANVLMSYDFDWPGAEREFKVAIDLSPNLADAHHNYAMYLAGVGRHDEAHTEIERALTLDPLSLVTLNDAGWIYYLARQYDRTIALNQKALDLDEHFWPAYRDLGLGYEHAGRYADAVAALEKARQIDANTTVLEMLGGVYAAWGKKDEAKKVLADLATMATEHYVCPYEVATVHAGLGDKAATLEWLEKGYKERADCMAWAASDPKLDVLRGDPRFEDLLKRLGIPH